MPATKKKISREEMIKKFESPDYDPFEGKGESEIEWVRGRAGGVVPAPISVRLSEPLLERLDRIAAREHRKRSNLIQHILWEFVHGDQ